MNQSIDLGAFDKNSKKQWIEKVSNDLKGTNPLEALQWQHINDLGVAPMYFEEDLPSSTISISSQRVSNNWVNLSYIDPADESITKNLGDIAECCDGFYLSRLKHHTKRSILGEIAHLKDALFFNDPDTPLLDEIVEVVASHHHGSLGLNLLGKGLTDDQLKSALDDWLQSYHHKTSNFGIITIPGNQFVDEGADIVLETAIILSQLITYYDVMLSLGMDTRSVVDKVIVSTSIGQDYFHEVGKLRALHYLIKNIHAQFGISDGDVNILGTTSFRYKTAIEPNNNLVRNTVETLAAVVGGCRYLAVNPFRPGLDWCRVATNTGNLLKEEGLLDRVVDPAAGSFYLENLTDQIAGMSWILFQEIEKIGGYLEAVSSGWLKAEMLKRRSFAEQMMNSGEIGIVNVNKYRNLDSSVDSEFLIDGEFRLSTIEEEGRMQ